MRDDIPQDTRGEIQSTDDSRVIIVATLSKAMVTQRPFSSVALSMRVRKDRPKRGVAHFLDSRPTVMSPALLGSFLGCERGMSQLAREC